MSPPVSSTPVLFPEIQRELLRAARARLAHEHRRMLTLRASILACIIAILLTAPPCAALNVSHPDSAHQQSLGNG